MTIKVEFEGTDGAGKTMGLKYFTERARLKGFKVIETREVGNPHIPACIKLRELILNPDSNLSGEAMELIFSAMRLENDKWFRNLTANTDTRPDLVVSDRGWLSHLAYTDHNVSEAFTRKLYENLMASETLLPDCVVYFNINTEIALTRRTARGTSDVIEQKGAAFQEAVRKSFDKYKLIYGSQIRVLEVDANGSVEDVKRQLDRILDIII